MTHHTHKILILDFGSQYSQLIARRVRECGVYSEMHTFHMSDDDIKAFQPNAIILSGGPESVTEVNSARAPSMVFELGVPVLGICYGMQTMAAQLGGKVTAGDKREFGYAEVTVQDASALFHGIEDKVNEKGVSLLDTWMSHGDHVSVLPPNFKAIASTHSCGIVGMADEARRFYGLQFHPEVSHTKQGMRIIQRFVNDIAACPVSFTPTNIIEEQVREIREKVGSDKVLLGLSGGVDSSVAALLLHQAIGEQLVCVFVDTGFLRLNEVEQVQTLFAKHFGIKLITVNASEAFYSALKGIDDPEVKRKIAGKCFVDVFEAEAAKIDNVKWLAQGTIYSDVIESAATKTGKAHVIKSHHNVGGLPETMRLALLEPLRELFKDEVRKVGLALGLPHDLIHRHPFPGPGLVIRVLGDIQPDYVKKLQLADAIFIEELHHAKLYHKVSQAFAVFLPVKSVGVVGDARQYEPVIALRAVESHDFMTAHWAHLPYAFLEKVSNRIINEVRGISRVVYDISGKPPATIEWE
jgi:GMP synthase (glutamine-hydrolysing)